MRSFLSYFLLLYVALFDLSAFDIQHYCGHYNVSHMCMFDDQKHASGTFLNVNCSFKHRGQDVNNVYFISCQHMLTGNTYDFFGDRHASISLVCGCALRDELFEHFYNVAAKKYHNIILSSYRCNKMKVNITKHISSINLHSNGLTDGNMAVYQEKYITFCESGIDLPIDISVLFAENVDTSFAKVHDLPTSDQVSSWKNRICNATMYGYLASNECEYSISCEMKLTDCGNWFKSVEPIPSDFIDLHGMSGGPCFVDDVLCGVISGCDNEKHLCVRALTVGLVEAIKFGVERFMDK